MYGGVFDSDTVCNQNKHAPASVSAQVLSLSRTHKLVNPETVIDAIGTLDEEVALPHSLQLAT